jgi:hypothetical protein
VERATSASNWAVKQTTAWDYFANGKLRTLAITGDSPTPLETHSASTPPVPTQDDTHSSGCCAAACLESDHAALGSERTVRSQRGDVDR